MSGAVLIVFVLRCEDDTGLSANVIGLFDPLISGVLAMSDLVFGGGGGGAGACM